MPSRVEWERRMRIAATTFPEAHASVSLCYKSFRDTQKGHNTFLSLFSYPSILSFFYYWTQFLWAPNLPFGMIKKREEDARDVRLTRQENREKNRWNGRGGGVESSCCSVWFHTGIRCLKGHRVIYALDPLCFLIVRLLLNNCWFLLCAGKWRCA